VTAVIADPAWRAQVADEGLVLYAGADLNYLIPDLPAAHAQALAALFEPASAPMEPEDQPEGVRLVLPQLRALGAVRPAVLPTPRRPRTLTVAVRIAGTAMETLTDALLDAFPPVAEPELTLVVRTTATLRELAKLAGELDGPQLLLDVGYHHTASLGPLVVPGGTACLACMSVRAARRWGDPPQPAAPGAADAPGLPVALAVHAISRIGAGSLALLERVVSYRLDEFTATAEDVLPAADCPVCPRIPVGRATLPWEEQR
jgi:hypothetical protein